MLNSSRYYFIFHNLYKCKFLYIISIYKYNKVNYITYKNNKYIIGLI